MDPDPAMNMEPMDDAMMDKGMDMMEKGMGMMDMCCGDKMKKAPMQKAPMKKAPMKKAAPMGDHM
jgi:hypothetical protein